MWLQNKKGQPVTGNNWANSSDEFFKSQQQTKNDRSPVQNKKQQQKKTGDISRQKYYLATCRHASKYPTKCRQRAILLFVCEMRLLLVSRNTWEPGQTERVVVNAASWTNGTARFMSALYGVVYAEIISELMLVGCYIKFLSTVSGPAVQSMHCSFMKLFLFFKLQFMPVIWNRLAFN